MHQAIGGSDESTGEPFIMSIGGRLDQQVIAGPVNKDRIEDIQIWSAVQALAIRDALRHPLAITPGGDPPDRILSSGNQTWGTELTELTIQDIRKDLAPVRMFGRELQQRLRDQHERFTHLNGRIVMLTKLRDHDVPRNIDRMLQDVEQALEEDRGFFGEDMDWSSGAPKRLGERGQYGEHGAFRILVNNTNGSGEVEVTATSQFELYRSKALAALEARVEAKDKDCNQIVIVTCGLPDRQGYICPSDHDLFNVLRGAAQENIPILTKPLKHIQGILIHLWGSNEIFACGETDDVPWVRG